MRIALVLALYALIAGVYAPEAGSCTADDQCTSDQYCSDGACVQQLCTSDEQCPLDNAGALQKCDQTGRVYACVAAGAASTVDTGTSSEPTDASPEAPVVVVNDSTNTATDGSADTATDGLSNSDSTDSTDTSSGEESAGTSAGGSTDTATDDTSADSASGAADGSTGTTVSSGTTSAPSASDSTDTATGDSSDTAPDDSSVNNDAASDSTGTTPGDESADAAVTSGSGSAEDNKSPSSSQTSSGSTSSSVVADSATQDTSSSADTSSNSQSVADKEVELTTSTVNNVCVPACADDKYCDDSVVPATCKDKCSVPANNGQSCGTSKICSSGKCVDICKVKGKNTPCGTPGAGYVCDGLQSCVPYCLVTSNAGKSCFTSTLAQGVCIKWKCIDTSCSTPDAACTLISGDPGKCDQNHQCKLYYCDPSNDTCTNGRYCKSPTEGCQYGCKTPGAACTVPGRDVPGICTITHMCQPNLCDPNNDMCPQGMYCRNRVEGCLMGCKKLGEACYKDGLTGTCNLYHQCDQFACNPSADKCPYGLYCDAGSRRCIKGCKPGERCARDDMADGICTAQRTCEAPKKKCNPQQDRCPQGYFCRPSSLKCASGCKINEPCVAAGGKPGKCNYDHVCIAAATKQCNPQQDKCPQGYFCRPSSLKCASGCKINEPCVAAGGKPGKCNYDHVCIAAATKQCNPQQDKCPQGYFCRPSSLKCASGCKINEPCVAAGGKPGKCNYDHVCVAAATKQCNPQQDKCPQGYFCHSSSLKCAKGCKQGEPCHLATGKTGMCNSQHACVAPTYKRCSKNADCSSLQYCNKTTKRCENRAGSPCHAKTANSCLAGHVCKADHGTAGAGRCYPLAKKLMPCGESHLQYPHVCPQGLQCLRASATSTAKVCRNP